MTPGAAVTIVNVGYRATNYWVVNAGESRLLVDLGYPGTMGMMRAGLERMGIPLEEIRYALATLLASIGNTQQPVPGCG